MTLSEILPRFLAGEKIRRESWGDKTHYLIAVTNKIFDERNQKQKLGDDAIFATDWELFKEPEPKDQSAVERLSNSGFENICLDMNIAGSYRCSFDALGREFVGGGATSEKAAANAIANFKYFITGL